MKTIKTTIRIDASPQTVWSIMDDLQGRRRVRPTGVRRLRELAQRDRYQPVVHGDDPRPLCGTDDSTYDAFSPEIMDLIAWHRRKIDRLPQPAQ